MLICCFSPRPLLSISISSSPLVFYALLRAATPLLFEKTGIALPQTTSSTIAIRAGRGAA